MAGTFDKDDYDDLTDYDSDTGNESELDFAKEWYEEKGCLALTITLNPKYLSDDVSLHQALFITKNKLIRILKRSCKFLMVAELGEVTGQLHYHGVIKVTDPIKYRKSTLRQLRRQLGHIVVKPVKQIEVWRKYYEKDMKITEAVFERKQIRFTHEDRPDKVKVIERVRNDIVDITKWFV